MATLNKAADVLIAEGSQPSPDSKSGITLKGMSTPYANANIPSGSLTIWANASVAGKKGLLAI